MKKDLDTILSQQFHEEYSPIIFEAYKVLIEFCDKDDQIFIDARNFPAIITEIKQSKDIVEFIPQSLFKEYAYCLSQTSETKRLMVYLYKDSFILYLYDLDKEPYEFDMSTNSSDEMSKYIKVYAKGLVKEAYTKAQESGLPFVFAIIDGEAFVLSDDQAVELLNQKEDFDFEDWLHTCIADSESLVSFLYIDNSKNIIWYNILSSRYEDLLRQYWNE